MSKFAKNSSSKVNFVAKTNPAVKKTVNKAGGEGFTLPAKERLATRLLTSLVNEKMFYGDTTPELLKDIREVASTDPVFVLKLAAYARTVMHMRSAPVYAFAQASLINEVKPHLRNWVKGIVRRADEPAEVLAIINDHFAHNTQKPVIPNAVKKSLADVVGGFGAYELMKYKGEGNSVNLWDVFNICHPRPTNAEQAELWNKFMKNELEAANTWEVNISRDGSTKASWEKTIPVMGYMALLRNLRNFIEKDVSEDLLKKVADKLSDAKAVRNSKQLPFRFFSAYRELSNIMSPENKRRIDVLRNAISTALDISCESCEKLPGVTAIFTDHSGSMDQKISDKSSVSRKEVGLVLHGLADRVNPDNVGILFGESIGAVDSNGLSTLRFIDAMTKANVGHSTNAHLAFEYLLKNKIKVDRIILISDMQCYGQRYSSTDIAEVWNNYRKQINPNAWLHSVDLAGYGTTVAPVNGKNVGLYAGWTDKFLDLIAWNEKGTSSLIQEIESFSLEDKMEEVAYEENIS